MMNYGLRWVGRLSAGAVLAAVGVALMSAPAFAEEENTPMFDQGVRQIATLAGYLAYGLMVMTIGFGILTTTGWARRMIKRQTLNGMHNVLAVTFLSFGVIHGIAYVFQVGEPFSFVNVAIPLVSGGEIPVAYGIVGTELALAIAFSIAIQRVLGYQRWHLVHYLAYPAFVLIVVHTFTTSAEVQALEIIGGAVVGLAAAVVLMFILRFIPGSTLVAARISPRED